MNLKKLRDEIVILKKQIKEGHNLSKFHLKGIKQTVEAFNNEPYCMVGVECKKEWQKIKKLLGIKIWMRLTKK